MKMPKVGVIGLAGQSAFLAADHFPAPGETVKCTKLFFELGGKGYNQAVACSHMGVPAVFIGAVGRDNNGKACREELTREGVTPCLIVKEIPTAFAVITTDSSAENTVSVFPGAAKALTPKDLRSEEVMAQLRECTYLLLQNELSADCLAEACRIGQELGIPVILNPAPAQNIAPEVLRACGLITPNYGEAKCLTGISEREQPTGRELADRFARQGIFNAVITMGSQGAMVMERGKPRHIRAFSPAQPVDTTGAGDTFNGVLAAMLACEADLFDAALTASIAAGISVTRPGAAGSIPTKAEVDACRW